jgi:hypothetical protein
MSLCFNLKLRPAACEADGITRSLADSTQTSEFHHMKLVTYKTSFFSHWGIAMITYWTGRINIGGIRAPGVPISPPGEPD